MRYLPLLAVAALGTALTAQNEFMYLPKTLTYTSRGSLSTNAGEILQGMHASSNRAMGDDGSKIQIVGFTARNFQDQNRTTAETYHWVVRSGTDAKGPTLGTAGELGVAGPLKLGPATGTGAVSYLVTDTLKTPISVPADKFFCYGARLTTSKWTSDGQSVWIGAKIGTVNNNFAGPQQVDQAWQIVTTTTGSSVSHPSGMRVWRMGLLVANPVLQAGNVYPAAATGNFSIGGLYPDTVGGQGLAFRIRNKGGAGQLGLVLFSGGFGPAGLPVVPGTRLWLNLGTFLPVTHSVGVLAGATGEGSKVWLPKLPASAKGVKLAAQGLVVDVKKLQIALTQALLMTL